MARKTAYHHGDLRKALLAEAANIVETDGVPALTLREIARRLGVSHAAPGHHFADKATLLGELAAEGFDELSRELEQGQTKGRTPVARLCEAGRGYLRFALKRPGHYRVMFGGALKDAAKSPHLAAAGARAYEALRSAVIAAMPAARAKNALHVEQAAFLAWSATHGAAMLLLDGPVPGDLPANAKRDAVRTLTDSLTDAVAASIARG